MVGVIFSFSGENQIKSKISDEKKNNQSIAIVRFSEKIVHSILYHKAMVVTIFCDHGLVSIFKFTFTLYYVIYDP